MCLKNMSFVNPEKVRLGDGDDKKVITLEISQGIVEGILVEYFKCKILDEEKEVEVFYLTSFVGCQIEAMRRMELIKSAKKEKDSISRGEEVAA